MLNLKDLKKPRLRGYYGFTVDVADERGYRHLRVKILRGGEHCGSACAPSVSLTWQANREGAGWGKYYGGSMEADTHCDTGYLSVARLSLLLQALARVIPTLDEGPAVALAALESAGVEQVGEDVTDHTYMPREDLPPAGTTVWRDADLSGCCRVNAFCPPSDRGSAGGRAAVRLALAGKNDNGKGLAEWIAAGEQVAYVREQPACPPAWRALAGVPEAAVTP